MRKRTEHKPAKGRVTSDANEILAHMSGTSLRAKAEYERAREAVNIAQRVYDARTAAGLSQKQLAALVGTTQSVIARLEDADYRGHSLSMLRRIAGALECDCDFRFVPRPNSRAA